MVRVTMTKSPVPLVPVGGQADPGAAARPSVIQVWTGRWPDILHTARVTSNVLRSPSTCAKRSEDQEGCPAPPGPETALQPAARRALRISFGRIRFLDGFSQARIAATVQIQVGMGGALPLHGLCRR